MLVAIEGLDGVGKQTQTEIFRRRAAEASRSVATLSFPRYGETSFSALVTTYLNGGFGHLDQVSPYLSSLLFAGDRFETREKLLSLIEVNDLVLLDRYVASNLAYQAARVPEEDRERFIGWLSNLEYDTYGLPKADLTLYLDAPVATAGRMIQGRAPRAYTTLVADIHEADVALLQACRTIYHRLAHANHYSRWTWINCVDVFGDMLPPEVIGETVWAEVNRIAQSKRAPLA